MCGLVGFCGDRIDINATRSLLLANERERGGDAFGWAWIDEAGRLRCFKRAGLFAAHRDSIEMVGGAKMFIGHLRWASVGNAGDTLNAHPHPCDGGWVVHNGTLGAIPEGLADDMTTACDSEAISRLAEILPGRNPGVRLLKAAAWASGDGTHHALMGLWRSPLVMVVACEGKPLYLANHKTGSYITSLPILKGARAMKPSEHLTLTPRKAKK